MRTNILMLILVLLLAFANSSQSQTPCPPSYGDPSWPNELELASFATGVPGSESYGFVQYNSRGGITTYYEIVVDWTTLSSMRPYGVSDEEYKEWMRLAVIRDLLGNWLSIGNPCNFSGTKQFIFYEESPCLVDKVCYFKLIYNNEIFCVDDEWPGDIPEFFSHQGENWYGRLTERVDCGSKACCTVTYTMECINGTLHIASILKSELPGSECVQGNDIRCFDSMPMPCNSNCNNQ